jgi:hypothetical protein
LNSIEKIKRKYISKFKKKENKFRPSSAQLARPRSLSPSARWGRSVDSSCLRPRSPLSLSAMWARLVSARCLRPRACAFAPWAHPVSLVFSATAVDQRAHMMRSSATSPAHSPQLLLSPANSRSLSPASFCPRSPSLALCRRRICSPKIHAHRVVRPARQKTCRAV